MLQINQDQGYGAGGQRGSAAAPLRHQFDDLGVALRGLYAALRRQLTLIIAVVILSLALGVAYVLVAPKKYTSETSVLVDMRRPGLFNNGQGLQLSTVDSSAIDSQVELLRSERVALRVIQKLNLLEDPNQIRGTSSLGFVKSAVYERLGMEGEPETPQTIQRSVLEAFQRNTRVEREGLTYVITISYSAFDRDLAARIANAIAAAYLTDQLEAKLEATRLANTWLEERVTDLRAGLLKAETAVATYKSQNNIVDAAGTLVNERELNEINTQLVNARAQLGETQARFDRIQALIDRKDVGNATINDVINSTSVQRLRGQYQDLARRESDIRRRLGPQHGAVIQTRQEMAETERQILEEFERIAEGMRSELAIVRQRVESLEKAQRDATSVAQRTNEKRVKLGELERDLNASRSLYESFLTRFKTTAQDESFPISEARVVTEAAPARFPSHPKSLLVLALAGGAGVLLGVGLGLMRERLDDVIRSGEDLEAVTGTEMLGVVPSFGDDITRQKISRHTLANVRKLTPVQQTERLLPHDLGYLRYAVDYPFSRTAETMRSVKLALQFAAAPADDCVVGIVSALPNEGKSSVAANLAHHLASTGSRTLLIDCDLRNPSITRQIAGRTPGGLPDILYRNGSLESLVFVDPVTGMHFLSAGTRSAIHQTDELLGSDRMREFLQMLKKGYDYVVLDLPPIVPTVDARAIAPVVDAFVYVVEWGKTPREVVRQALRSSDQITSRLVGSVLNKVRHDSLRLYDSYAALTYGQDYGATPSPKKDRAA